MKKDSIERLRTAARQRFDGSKTPEDVKLATEELSLLDEIEKDADELEKANASLLASYKEIVKGQPIDKKDVPPDEDEGGGLSFDEALSKVLSARKEK